MCLGIPGKILSIDENKIAVVDTMGVKKEVSLALTPEAKIGEYIVNHAGFALHVIDEKEALETLELFKELDGQAS